MAPTAPTPPGFGERTTHDGSPDPHRPPPLLARHGPGARPAPDYPDTGRAALAGYLVTCVAYPAPLIPRDREVTRVLGLPLPEAEKELDEQGFKPKVEGEDADPVIPAGHIVWQDPPPETTLPGGTTIHLTVSSGPAAVSVPDVISFELDQARQVMDAAGLRIGTIDSIPSSSEPGMIIATRPPVGSSKPPGSAVDIVMSKGPADIRVPDVVGLKQEEARDRLEAAGLKVGLWTLPQPRPGGGPLPGQGPAEPPLLPERPEGQGGPDQGKAVSGAMSRLPGSVGILADPEGFWRFQGLTLIAGVDEVGRGPLAVWWWPQP